MRNILLLLSTFLFKAVPGVAATTPDFYSDHWDKVEKAISNDFPATAQQEIDIIRSRATREGNMPQLCRALFVSLECKAEISPDSIESSVAAIEAAMNAETRPVQRAVYQHLLGRCRYDNALIDAALANKEVLISASAQDYLPLIVLGEDSHAYFGNDLLHLFLRESYTSRHDEHIKEAQRLYEARGNKVASLLLMELLHIAEGERYDTWRKAANEDVSLMKVPAISEYLNRVERPSVSLECDESKAAMPGAPLTFVAKARNISEATLTIAGQTHTFHFAPSPAWQERADTLSVTIDKAGIYEATLKWGKLRSTCKVRISAVKPLIFGLPDGRSRVAMVHAATGKLLSQASLIRRDKHGRKETTFRAAADGYIYLKKSDYEWSSVGDVDFFIVAGNDNFHAPLSPWDFVQGYYQNYGEVKDEKVEVFTDRNLYRPGQKVHVGVMAYSRHDDEYKALPGEELTIALLNSNSKEVASHTVHADDMGSASAEFTLPRVCMPGYFCVVVSGAKSKLGGIHSFRVEEYKRPTVEIKIDELTGAFSEGDTAVVTGLVQTYTGVPLADTEVRTSVGDTLRTDVRGRFAVPVEVKAERRWWWRRMQVEVSALASNGETVSATAHIPLKMWREDSAEAAPDKHTMPFWHEISTPAKGETLLTVGSCHPACRLFVDVVSGNRVVEHKIVEFTDSFSYHLKYREEWGDGAVCHVAMVRNGEFFTTFAAVKRPEPDKRLLLRWSTFRSHLQPGTEETWTLRVTDPAGRPANALVMARLYDATLDALQSNQWFFSLNFLRHLPSCSWRSPQWSFDGLHLAQELPAVRAMQYNTWWPNLFSYFSSISHRKMRVRGEKMMMAKAAPMDMQVNATMASADDMKETMVAETAGAGVEKPQAVVRENFDETAFFFPALRTDEKGDVSMSFRLPESLTSWNFTALAHDKDMNYGMLTDTVVARKELMAEIAAPRFLREGDRTAIPVTLTNLISEAQTCQVRFWLDDAVQTTTVELAAEGRTTITFPYEARLTEAGFVTLRVEASSANFSDGEERAVPVLTNLVEVTRSVPYTLNNKGEHKVDISALWNDVKNPLQLRFTTEQCNNPAWYVANAVAPMLDEKAESAISWATRLYALRMAAHVKDYLPALQPAASSESAFERNADLRQTILEESPWLVQAEDEAKRMEKMAEMLDETALEAGMKQALERLSAAQLGSGAWAWFDGMEPSPMVTRDVCTLLARLQVLTGENEDVATMIEKGMKYLRGELNRDVAEMKAYEKKHRTTLSASERHFEYLYLCTLTHGKADADVRYLLEKVMKQNHELSMYGKAGTAVILHYFASQDAKMSPSYEKRAKVQIKGLLEHTVYTDEMGRYFDTERAMSGWRSYRIPTQVHTIEAVQNVEGEQNSHEVLSQLRMWLLQSKRTQQWMTSRTTADAVYAVLVGQENAFTPDAAGTGYSRHTEILGQDAERPMSLTVENTTEHPLWGAAYVQYLVPMTEVMGEGSGLKLTRTIDLPKGGVKVGDRLTITYTLRAERDMDFVSVKSAHAACLVPTRPLSGYDWHTGAYRAVRDQRTDYFFEHLSKGTHTFTEEVVVDRKGTFTMGIATAECVYAPEFRAITANERLTVK